MLVHHFMSRDVVTLKEGDLCVDAYQMFRSRRLRRAPVLCGDAVVGMLSERDLLRALPWSHWDGKRFERDADLSRTVASYMTRRVIHVTPDTHVEDVARLMLEHKIGGLPVIEGERLVGMITESDIFRIFVSMGLEARGTRITLQAPDATPGTPVPDPVRSCLERGQLLRGLARYTSPAGTTMVTLHVAGADADELPEALSQLGFVLVDVAHPAPPRDEEK